MAAMLSCPDRRDLQRLLLGWVVDDEAENLEAHCATCPRCLETMRTLESEDALVSAVRGGVGKLLIPEQRVDGQLLDRLYDLGRLLPERTASADSSPPPALLGFDLLEKLGRGGMGVVYKALQHRPRRVVALKLLRFGLADDSDVRERFHVEADIVARLEHPNIVRVYEVGEAPAYLAMEYVDGGSLADRLARAPLPASEAARLVEALARALAVAHRSGIVHRDVKPGNVLLAGGVVPKLADFGLAKIRGDDAGRTRTGAVLGTPSYMAPEQAEGRRDIGPTADIYALGALLYECLTGRPPFRAATVLETLDQVRLVDPVSPRRLMPGLSRDLETICLKCLHKEPTRRYPTAEELAEDLTHFLDGRPIRARPLGRLARALRWAKRRPAAAALIVVSGLALVAGAGGAAVYERQLRAERDRAEAHREQATANYRAARETLQQMLARLDDRRRADVPAVKELRRAQQEDALAFLLRAAEPRGDDPEVRSDVAYAHYAAGRLQRDLGRPDEAKVHLARACDLWAALATEYPGASGFRRQWADSLQARALAHGDTDEAIRFQEQALALYEALVAEPTAGPSHRHGLAISHNLLGASVYARRDLAAAEAHYRAAADIMEGLLKDDPENANRRSYLAGIQVNLSLLYQQSSHKNLELSRRFRDQARASLERLLRDDPLDAGSADLLASQRVNGGYLLLEEKKYEEVLAEMKANVALLTPFLEREPTHVEVRQRLRSTHGLWATVLEGQGRHVDEVPHRRRVVELATPEQKEKDRVHLAWTLARAGDHAAAFAEAGVLKEIKETKMLLHLAQTCAVAATKAQSDKALSSNERDAQAERYAAAAVQYLGQLKERLGPKVWRAQIIILALDGYLKELHSREDYRRLVAAP